MENSRKTRSPDLQQSFKAFLDRHVGSTRPLQLCVGLSGGLDSVVLLHLTATYTLHAQCEVSAVHVHHGLSENADNWADFSRKIADSLFISCAVERVVVDQCAELGVEAAARVARYAVFERQSCDFLLLAHHRDDQAETVLLNLLRGSGVRGLAAMPECRPLQSGTRLLRPLLDVSRKELLLYAQENKLSWIEDESNADQSMDRNYLRHRVVPLLDTRFPGTKTALARSAQHLAEADVLLEEIALVDMKHCVSGAIFNLTAALQLSEARRRNVMRHWLSLAGVVPDTRAFDALLRMMFYARDDAEPRWRWRIHEVRRYRGQLYLLPADAKAGLSCELQWPCDLTVGISGWCGSLQWKKSDGLGIAERFLSGKLELRPRTGGEKMRPQPTGHTRTLKHLWQEAGIPPWRRDIVPILWIDGRVAAVPGLWVAAEFTEPGGWLPDWKFGSV